MTVSHDDGNAHPWLSGPIDSLLHCHLELPAGLTPLDYRGRPPNPSTLCDLLNAAILLQSHRCVKYGREAAEEYPHHHTPPHLRAAYTSRVKRALEEMEIVSSDTDCSEAAAERPQKRRAMTRPCVELERSHTPTSPSEEQRARQDLSVRKSVARSASLPYYQFKAHRRHEEQRLRTADSNGTQRQPARVDFYELAHHNVRRRWDEQRIWNEEWAETALGAVWKHEQPLQLLHRSARCPLCETSFLPTGSQSKVKLGNEDSKSAELRKSLERDREASRPFFQFLYQVSHEREQIQRELNLEQETINISSADINTRAYESVKSNWIDWKIWDSRWGVLPGMAWKHEQPFEEDGMEFAISGQNQRVRSRTAPEVGANRVDKSAAISAAEALYVELDSESTKACVFDRGRPESISSPQKRNATRSRGLTKKPISNLKRPKYTRKIKARQRTKPLRGVVSVDPLLDPFVAGQSPRTAKNLRRSPRLASKHQVSRGV